MGNEDTKGVKVFEVHGPFRVAVAKGKWGRGIANDERLRFWASNPEAEPLRKRVGCYVFAIRAAKGIRPVYVGRATKNFESEIFQAHKLLKYNEELREIGKGAPVMFFIAHPSGRGIPNKKMIADLEDFLIKVAIARNPGLRNIRGIKEKQWGNPGRASFRARCGIKGQSAVQSNHGFSEAEVGMSPFLLRFVSTDPAARERASHLRAFPQDATQSPHGEAAPSLQWCRLQLRVLASRERRRSSHFEVFSNTDAYSVISTQSAEVGEASPLTEMAPRCGAISLTC